MLFVSRKAGAVLADLGDGAGLVIPAALRVALGGLWAVALTITAQQQKRSVLLEAFSVACGAPAWANAAGGFSARSGKTLLLSQAGLAETELTRAGWRAHWHRQHLLFAKPGEVLPRLHAVVKDFAQPGFPRNRCDCKPQHRGTLPGHCPG